MGLLSRISNWFSGSENTNSPVTEKSSESLTFEKTFNVDITRHVDLIIHPNNGGSTIVAYDDLECNDYNVIVEVVGSVADNIETPSTYASYRTDNIVRFRYSTTTKIKDASIQQKTNLGNIDATIVINTDIEHRYMYVENPEDVSNSDLRSAGFSRFTGDMYLENHDEDDEVWIDTSRYESTVKDWRIEQDQSVRDIVKNNLNHSKSMNVAAFNQPFMVPEFQVGADGQGQSDIAALPSDHIQR